MIRVYVVLLILTVLWSVAYCFEFGGWKLKATKIATGLLLLLAIVWKLFGGSTMDNFGAGVAAMRAGDYRTAKAAFKEAVKDSNDVLAKGCLAECCYRLEEVGEASALAEQIKPAEGGRAKGNLVLGWIAEREGRTQDALELYRLAAIAGSTSGRLRFNKLTGVQ
jgi:hypothetical protein